MIEKYFLEMLTPDNVSVKKETYIVQDGKEYVVGNPWRRAYINSIQGRNQVQSEVPEPYKSVIMLMWGEHPTILD